ncbi:methyl farnesoate epoxidase-like [Condylostylus longicornis]|uniref:methyl farnesoate epoxidase-like n=1 Tax=Condylostylus longicornis TaxID=2530218 RepID=UPI00244E3DA4|nr:methyl farnesoate epoxidase-like [Condylostylus longicornis]
MVLVALFLFCLILTFIWKDTRKPKKFPPGPKWYPIVGCIPLLQRLINIFKFYHLMWEHFATIWGPVVGFRIGCDRVILISGIDAVKEFYSIDEFNGRPNGFFFKVRSFNKRLGIVFTDGKEWEVQRRFSMKILKQLMGIGKNGLIHIEIEAQKMIENFRKKAIKKELLEMQHLFDIPVLNVMWALLAGYTFDVDDTKLLNLVKLIHECFRDIDMSGGILNQFPFIRYFFPEKCGYNKMIKNTKPLLSFLTERIKEIKDKIGTNNLNKEIKSLIEAYLIEIEKFKNDKSTFTAEQLLIICLDFFQAGSETTSNTLGFGLIYMLHYPEILEKVRAEIYGVIGQNRLLKLSDRNNLPYTEAVIYEIQRISSVAPLAIIHRTLQTVNYQNYIIPKNTLALVSIYSLNMDKKYWIDPHNFRPERFLNNDGKLIHHEYFIPFGLGKRRCVGEMLARSSLFLFFAIFVQNFDIELQDHKNLPEKIGFDGITLSPKPYKAYLKIRKFTNNYKN